MNISEIGQFKNDGQGALEYIILLAVCSALLVFSSPLLVQIRDALDSTFANAVERIMNPHPAATAKH